MIERKMFCLKIKMNNNNRKKLFIMCEDYSYFTIVSMDIILSKLYIL